MELWENYWNILICGDIILGHSLIIIKCDWESFFSEIEKLTSSIKDKKGQ